MFKIAAILVVSGLLSAILCAPPKNDQVPSAEHETPAVNYRYTWDVIDDFKGIDAGHTEDRTGGSTRGQYWVLLPDGRRQVVSYSAHPKTGYTVSISYDGATSTH